MTSIRPQVISMSEMRKRLMVVVDYVGKCPRCGKEQCANSEKLAD